jgi:hypothetical protein
MPKPASVYEEKLARYRREVLEDAIYRCGGNQTKAAADLGIHRNTLYRLVASAGVDLVRIKMLLCKRKLKVPYESYLCRGLDAAKGNHRPAGASFAINANGHDVRGSARLPQSARGAGPSNQLAR